MIEPVPATFRRASTSAAELRRDPLLGRLHLTRLALAIYDDSGRHGRLKPGERFVIAGDQNSDPVDGDSVEGAIQQLIEHPLVNAKVTRRAPAAPRRPRSREA